MTVIENNLDNYHPAWGIHMPAWRKAAVRALRDDPEGAVQHLEEARELGLFIYWRNTIFDHPVFMPLADHPAFRRLRAELEAESERQRERAYELLGMES